MKTTFQPLIDAILAGLTEESGAEAGRLQREGISEEDIVTKGIEEAMSRLDAKCTVEEFNLLEIMLAGRAVNHVLDIMFPVVQGMSAQAGPKVVLASLEGDVHDLGKNLVATVLRAKGFAVVDAGKNCSVGRIVEFVTKENPLAVGVSGLLTLVIPQVRLLREALDNVGCGPVKILAGGAALKQSNAPDLKVDFLADSVFDGARYLAEVRRQHIPEIIKSPPTPLEGIRQAVALQPPPRLPVIAQVFGHAAVRAGVPLLHYRRDGEVLASCQLEALKAYNYDAVFGVADVNVEVEALGAVLDEPEHAYANVVEPPWGATLVADPQIPDPQRAGRMPQILRALTILRKEAGQQHLVCGAVVGPFTLATQLLGLEKALFLLRDDPDRLAVVVAFCGKVAAAYGEAQLRAGAHVVILIDPSSSPAVLPPPLYPKVSAPVQRAVFSALMKAGSAANWLHMAGPINPILPHLPGTGANLVNVDYCVSLEEARRALPRTCLDGNLRPLAFVEENPITLAGEVHSLRKRFSGEGGWILSSGCEIPPDARPENIASMVQAAHSAH